MVKVAIFFHSSGLNGANLSLLDLIEKLDKNRIKLIFFLPEHDSTIESKIEGYGKIFVFKYGQSIRKADVNIWEICVAYLKFFYGIVNTLVKGSFVLRKEKVDIIYTNTSVIYNGALLAKLWSKPHIWHIREFLSKEHGIIPLLGEKKHYRVVNKYSAQIVVISKSLFDNYSQNISKEKLIELYDDVSERYNIMPSNNWCERKNKMIIVGNISRGKGQLIAIKAVKKIYKYNRDIKLFIAGNYTDIKYYKKICSYIKKYQLCKVIKILGNIEDINNLRREMGVEIVASKREAFGRVTIEGMMSGMIVLGASDSATKELISNGVNGFLFDLEDKYSLCRVINKVTKLSSNEADNIIECSKKFSMEFCKGRCAKKLMDIITDLYFER